MYRIIKKIAVLGLIYTTQLSSAQAEWKQVLNIRDLSPDFKYQACSHRLKYEHKVAAQYGNSAYSIDTYIPATSTTVISELDHVKLTFDLQPGKLQGLFAGGTNPAISAADQNALAGLLNSARITNSYISVAINRTNADVIQILAFGYKGERPESLLIPLNLDYLTMESDCPLAKIPGDANMDGCVDTKDIYIWYSNYIIRTFAKANNFGATLMDGDFNANTVLDTGDITIWSANMNKGCTPQFQNVGPSI